MKKLKIIFNILNIEFKKSILHNINTIKIYNLHYSRFLCLYFFLLTLVVIFFPPRFLPGNDL